MWSDRKWDLPLFPDSRRERIGLRTGEVYTNGQRGVREGRAPEGAARQDSDGAVDLPMR